MTPRQSTIEARKAFLDRPHYQLLVWHKGEVIPCTPERFFTRTSLIGDIADGQIEDDIYAVIESNPVEGTCADITEELRPLVLDRALDLGGEFIPKFCEGAERGPYGWDVPADERAA